MQNPVAASSPAALMQQNMQLRQALLASAPRFRKSLGTFGGASGNGITGGTTRVKLFNVGITTKLILDVVATFTINTATATASPKAPFNVIQNVKLTDYDGTDRVNVSGYQLWVAQSVRNKVVYGYNNESQTSVLNAPTVPTAVGAQTIRYQIEVPLAYNADTDLRGALLSQTAVGEAFLNLQWNPSFYTNGDADAVYNGGATTTVSGVSISVNVEQEYLLPQSVGGRVPMPMLDLMTVYELQGAIRTSDNISANAEKLINYPNLRSVVGFYANFMNNGIMNAATTDITKFRLIANGNNVIREYSPYTKLFDQRRWLSGDGDLRVGTYFEPHRDKPIETALFGNVQYGITPSSVSGSNTNFEVMFESFYTKGTALPGMTQSS
jgi:hypothetical protein